MLSSTFVGSQNTSYKVIVQDSCYSNLFYLFHLDGSLPSISSSTPPCIEGALQLFLTLTINELFLISKVLMSFTYTHEYEGKQLKHYRIFTTTPSHR
jgi:hypothetical protein